MRADRLIEILMLLRSSGSLTAAQIASRVGVSVRTIYRDMDALSISGVPVQADSGPSGGYRLLSGYEPCLTALTEDEVSALGLLTVPTGAVELGQSEPLRRALSKLLASVPRYKESAGERVRSRILVAPDSPDPGGPALDVLAPLQRAVLADLVTSLTMRLPFGLSVTQRVEPLGLVFSDGRWYLVFRYGTVKTRPVSSITAVTVSEERFSRDPGFELTHYWREVATEQERLGRAYAFEIRVAPTALGVAARVLSGRVRSLSGRHQALDETSHSHEPGARTRFPDVCEWPVLGACAASLSEARGAMLQLGGAVEVLRPAELRESVRDYAQQTLGRYRAADGNEK